MDSLVGTTSNVFVPEGYLTDFSKYSRKFERHLYETYFVVNNTTLVFVGGVTMKQMIPLVEKYFGQMKRAPEPTRYYGQEPKPSFEKRLIFRTSRIEPRVEMRFQMPGVGHPDRPAFEVIGEVSKNLFQNVLDKHDLKGKASINTRVIHTSRFGVPASINFTVTGAEKDLPAIEEAMLAAIKYMGENEMPDDDVNFAKKTLRTRWFRRNVDPNNLANEIGHFEVMDSWKTLKPFLEGRDKTTAADIQRLVKQYFIANNRSVGLVKAEETE
jgi:zinc protease